MTRKFVVIESPYTAATQEEIDANVRLARNVCRAAALNGFIPLASHLLFTQFLDDSLPDERALGISMGIQMADRLADQAWFVLREGQRLSDSRGMVYALSHWLGGPRIRYWRTPDNGETIREVTNFNEEKQRGSEEIPQEGSKADTATELNDRCQQLIKGESHSS